MACNAGVLNISVERGRGKPTRTTSTTRPGRELSTTTRSASSAASSTLCVTISTVRSIPLPDAQQLRRHPLARQCVECAERLIEQQDFGALRQRARDGRALRHPAGKVDGIFRSKPDSPTSASRSSVRCLDLDSATVLPSPAAARRCPAPCATAGAWAVGRPSPPAAVVCAAAAFQQHFSARRLQQPRDDAQQRRFAAA